MSTYRPSSARQRRCLPGRRTPPAAVTSIRNSPADATCSRARHRHRSGQLQGCPGPGSGHPRVARAVTPPGPSRRISTRWPRWQRTRSWPPTSTDCSRPPFRARRPCTSAAPRGALAPLQVLPDDPAASFWWSPTSPAPSSGSSRVWPGTTDPTTTTACPSSSGWGAGGCPRHTSTRASIKIHKARQENQ